MSYYDSDVRRTSRGIAGTPPWVGAQFDAGLRIYMQRVYRYMAGGLGLTGIVIASLINIFVGSSAFQFAISIIGVLVFVGLTAYDTQRIKEMYLESDTAEIAGKKAVLGALALYLDFINLFMMLLQLFGQRRQN